MRLKIRRYSDVCGLLTFKERFDYLKLEPINHEDPYDLCARSIKQSFYRTADWKRVRNQVVVRDRGCDLGLAGYEISGPVYVHHMNPINVEMFGEESLNEFLLNPDFLICVSKETHEAIHHGSEELLPAQPIERFPNDTCPWKIKMGVKN